MDINDIQRYEELYQIAVDRYMTEADFDISQWLEPKEYEEYLQLENTTVQPIINEMSA